MGTTRKRNKRRVKGCPTPHKIKYTKAFDAYKALLEIQAKDPLHGEVRIYKCRCGRHHLTSRK